MNLDGPTILAILGLFFASAGIVGKKRLARWDAVLARVVTGPQAVHRIIPDKIEGFFKRRNLHPAEVAVKTFRIVFIPIDVLIVLAVLIAVAANLPAYLAGRPVDLWAAIGNTVGWFMYSPPVTLLGYIFEGSILLLLLYFFLLLALEVSVWLISLPYRIAYWIEADSTLERALILVGLVLTLVGLLGPRVSDPDWGVVLICVVLIIGLLGVGWSKE